MTKKKSKSHYLLNSSHQSSVIIRYIYTKYSPQIMTLRPDMPIELIWVETLFPGVDDQQMKRSKET